MRKLSAVALCLAFLTLFASCVGNNQNQGDQNQSSPSDGLVASYIPCGGAPVLISLCYNGQQLVKSDGDNELWYFDTEEIPTDEQKELLSADTYDVYDFYSWRNEGTFTYAELSSLSPYVKLATSSKADNFIPAYTHKQFDVNAQSGIDDDIREKIKAHILDAGLTNTPVVITEIWTCDIDGDGTNEQLVHAQNYIYEYPLPDPEIGSEPISNLEGLGFYNILMLISDTLGNSVLSETILNVSEYDDLCFPGHSLPDTPYEDMEWRHALNVYFEDYFGQLRTFPMYACGEFMTFTENAPLVCDIDGDGAYEICVLYGVEYMPAEIYEIENGALRLSGRVILPV